MSTYDRRTLVRGAAWSIPVVAVAAHAPAFAASTDPPVINQTGITACKRPGQPGTGTNCQGYSFSINVTVQPDDPWTITLTNVVLNGASHLAGTIPTTFGVVSGASIINFVVCTNTSSPGPVTLSLTYSAKNERTMVTTTNLGGTYALGVVNPCK